MTDEQPSSLLDIVLARAISRPADLAIVELGSAEDVELNWAELVERADRTAALLLELNVRPGEPVVLQLPNSAETVLFALAALRIGAVCCPVMPLLRQHEIERVLNVSRARVMVVSAQFRRRALADEIITMAAAGRASRLAHLLVTGGDRTMIPSRMPVGAELSVHVLSQALAEAPERALSTSRDRDPFAHLLFTSGTTGEAKGVLHRASTLDHAVRVMTSRLGLTRADRVHIASPMAHHSGFLYGMWLALLLGCVQVVQPEWEANRALAAFDRWRGTFLQGASPFLHDLLAAVEDGARAPASLQTVVVTGCAVPRALVTRARTVLEASVCPAWGSTETCMATLVSPSDADDLTDGQPLEGVRLRVVDDAGTVLPPSAEGCLEVSSPSVFAGYFERPDLAADVFAADGWFRSGDVAVLDAAGRLRVTGRVKDVINRGGEKVPVSEVEQMLLEHQQIQDVAIVAMPDPRFGERACLFLVPVGDAKPSLVEVRSYLDTRQVARQYWPEHVELVPALPRNDAGKVLKAVLRSRARNLVAPLRKS